jgi:phosphoserine aminotransferase
MSSSKKRPYNFSPGPAALPTAVLERVKEEWLDFQGMGVSVIEFSHRHAVWTERAAKIEADFRRLLAIPNNYKVLFISTGATPHFSMVPLNLLGFKEKAAYINTGDWSKKAILEASKFAHVQVIASTEEYNYLKLPDFAEVPGPEELRDCAYVHYTPNETIRGVEFPEIPDFGDIPLVADFTSSILAEPLDVSKFGVIFAGAQKNIGPAGFSIAIVREDLLDRVSLNAPMFYQYKTYAETDSLANTPNVFAWYVSGLMFEWLEEQGGLTAMKELTEKKAKLLYDTIDGTDFYANRVDLGARSRISVPFDTVDEQLQKTFLEQAEENDLLFLKGHRLAGGMRASLYNSVSYEAVESLVDFMKDFEKNYG